MCQESRAEMEDHMLQEQILKNISKNARMTTEDLAIMLDAAPEEVEESIRKMEETGVICGYPALINWEKTDNEVVTALIEVKVTPQRGRGFDKVAERIYQFDEVASVYLMSGGFDLTVIIEGKSMKEVAKFVTTKLSPMESIMSTATYFVLKKYKEHGLPLVKESNEDERMLIAP